MPHRGLARRAAALFLAQFLVISYCERNARACAGPACAISSASRLAAATKSPSPSRHVTSRGSARARQHPRERFPESRTVHLRDRSRGKGVRGSRAPRGKNAANDLLQMLFPENGNNLQRSMWYCISRDFPDPDLHGERRMENDNHRHPGQDGREDHLRDQPLHDHPDLYFAHNRRFKEKYIHDAPMGGSGHHAGRRPSCERSLHLDHVLRKQRSSQRRSLARLRSNCRRGIHVHVAGGV